MPDRSTPASPHATPTENPPAGVTPVLSALASCQTTWQHADSWNGFIEALAPVEAAAVQAGHLALHDVCVILRRRIVELSRTRANPDEEQCAVLATWPSFASAWAEVPGEPRLAELLVDFLQHPMWPRALTDDEAEGLRVFLGVESGAYGTASLLEVVIEDINSNDEDENETGADDGLPGFDGLSGYASIGSSVAGGGRIVPDVRARMTGGDDADDGGETPAEQSETVHEMLRLLIGEASQIAAALADILPLATSESADEDARRDALERFAEQVERFNGAVEVLGLEGLYRAGRRFHENIGTLSAAGNALTPEVAELVVQVCAAIRDHLERPADRTAGGTLTSLLTHSAWPRPADAAWAAEVDARLAEPIADVEEDAGEVRAVEARPEDVSLELPDDVEREVLDDLLRDLPRRTAELSKSVGALASGGTSMDLEAALRTAHSVKGAAQTVGVTGVANLTHHLEDILASLTGHGVMPGRELGKVLVRATGCLDSMGRTLLGLSAPPADALDTLQTVLDWANTIHNEGAAAFADDIPPAATEVDPDTGILSGGIRERLGVTSRAAEILREQHEYVQQLCRELGALIEHEDPTGPRQRVAAGGALAAPEADRCGALRACSRRLEDAVADARVICRSLEDYLSALTGMLVEKGQSPED
jgi:chemosensory pili system protein ChpA (sensor histidine kinase/response regulator)